MRAILIDPFTRTVSDVHTSASLDDMYDLLGVDLITVLNVGGGHAMILDDEGLLREKDSQEYFTLNGMDQPLAGKAMILANVAGENRDATLPLDLVKEKVLFLDKEKIDPEAWCEWTITIC